MSDPYWGNVSLLLPMEGINGSTAFTDYSPSLKTVTRNGDPVISTARSKWGNGSGYFYDDSLTAPQSIPETADFTAEMWFNAANFASYIHILVSQKAEGTAVGALYFGVQNGSGYSRFTLLTRSGGSHFNVTLALDEWMHLAVSRSGSLFYVFRDGILLGTHADAGSITTANTYIGGYETNSSLTRGYFQDVRITSGVARYTANFTPPGALFYGLGSISGVVYEKDISGTYTPGAYPVYVYSRSTGALVGSTMSDNEGNYTIGPLLTDAEYYVMTLDNAVPIQKSAIRDKVVPS